MARVSTAARLEGGRAGGTQLTRIIAVLDALARSSGGLTRPELGNQLGMGRATTHRIVALLVQHGLVRLDEHQRALLGLTAARWGLAALDQLEIRAVARPYLQGLATKLGETTHLAVQSGASATYLERVDSPRSVRLASKLGDVVPLHSTALGKCLLTRYNTSKDIAALLGTDLKPCTEATIVNVERLAAEVSAIRSAGYALDRGENEDGVCCVAAPVRDHTGEIVAAISASGPEERMVTIEPIVDEVTHAAAALSAALGWLVSGTQLRSIV